MLEVMEDVACLMSGEGCIVWVGGELSFTSDDASVVLMWF